MNSFPGSLNHFSGSSEITRKLRIVMLVDAETVNPQDPEFSAGPDSELADMEYHIAAGLRRLGHGVQVLAFPSDHRQAIESLRHINPDVVFNLVEHIGGDRMLSPNIPALLEWLGIPYTGCSHIGMSLALDKALSKRLAREAGFRTPSFIVVSEKNRPISAEVQFPVIIKPRFGGGSEGITLNSVARNSRQLKSRANHIQRRLWQPAICEEFIEGREFSVAVLGNRDDVTALPVRETVFGCSHKGGPAFCTEKVKSSASYRKRWGITYIRANLPAAKEKQILNLCCRAFQRLELCGYARIDLRVTDDGDPVFLEANPNPDLTPRIYGLIASFAGMDYDTLLARILGLALARKSFQHLKRSSESPGRPSGAA